jgi:methionyl aminopeptidase
MTEYITVSDDDRVEARNGTIKLHGPDGFAGMRAAGQLAASILDALVPHVVPGVTTGELDDIVHKLMLEGGGFPATLGYRGYTKSCCISINHVVCHGIPGDKALKDGDIVNIDVTPILGGWHGDTSRMYLVGDVPLKARRLVDVTYECLMLGLGQARPGNPSSVMPKATATASSAISAATASAACSTTARKSSTPAAPALVRSFGPACSSRSSR